MKLHIFLPQDFSKLSSLNVQETHKMALSQIFNYTPFSSNPLLPPFNTSWDMSAPRMSSPETSCWLRAERVPAALSHTPFTPADTQPQPLHGALLPVRSFSLRGRGEQPRRALRAGGDHGAAVCSARECDSLQAAWPGSSSSQSS